MYGTSSSSHHVSRSLPRTSFRLVLRVSESCPKSICTMTITVCTHHSYPIRITIELSLFQLSRHRDSTEWREGRRWGGSRSTCMPSFATIRLLLIVKHKDRLCTT